MNAHIDPEDLEEREPKPKNEALILPLRSLTKTEIECDVADWLVKVREVHSDPDTYVFLKQLEHAVKTGLETIKGATFEKVCTDFQGEMKGSVLGHDVKLTWPERWEYSPAVEALKKQQKLDLEALQAEEKAKGLAHKGQGMGVLTVTLKSR